MKYFFVSRKEGKTPIVAQNKITNIKEVFTDFLAFYNKDNDLIAIIPKSEIIAIFTMEGAE